MTLRRISGRFNIKTKADFNKVSRILPIKLAVNAEKHFRSGFETVKGGGKTDDSLNGWDERKKTEKGPRRGILIKSGVLRRDVKQRMATFSRTIVGTSSITQDYADVHNSGLRSGRGSGFMMPKREFIGPSKVLEARNVKMIKEELKDLLI